MTPLERLLSPSLRRRPDAVLFDFDDTLSEHEELVLKAYERVFATLGTVPAGSAYPTPEVLLSDWFKDPNGWYAKYFPDHKRKDVYAEYTRLINTLPHTLELMPEAMETLENLKSQGIPMAIVSNKTQSILDKEIDALNLRPFFTAIIGKNEGIKTKPSPEPIEEAIKALKKKIPGFSPSYLWFVGDSIDDARAARTCWIQRFHLESHQEKGQSLVKKTNNELIENEIEQNDPHGGVIPLSGLGQLNKMLSALPLGAMGL